MPPGRQRTFDLIPTTLVKSNGPKPPMTSKAAKKAYQQANRGPRISRAEQRRLDAEELYRQKKEYERQKASAKARAAREKKADNAHAERNERKRLGIPEPNRFVRASQPTISTFVKSNGKRAWQEMDSIAEDLEGTVRDEDHQGDAGPPVKRVALDRKVKTEAHPLARTLATGEEHDVGVRLPETLLTIDEESEDEFGDFPSLSQSDLLQKIDSSLVSVKEISLKPPSPVSGPVPESELRNGTGSQKLPMRRLSQDEFPLKSQVLADTANAQLSSEAAETASKSDDGESPILLSPAQQIITSIPATCIVSRPQFMVSVHGLSRLVYEKPAKQPRPALEDRSVNMPPRSFISKVKSISFAPTPLQPLIRNTSSISSRRLSKKPPSCTQAFLENNLDDFLPSPSQELRELLSKVDDLPSNTQIAAELSPIKRKVTPGVHQHEETDYDDLICTQDLILSSQDLLEISPMKKKSKLKPIHRFPAAFAEGLFDNLPSTQELILSPQDLEEIETPSRASLKTANKLSGELRRLLAESSADGRREKQVKQQMVSLSKKSSQRLSQRPKEQSRQSPVEPKMNDKLKAAPRQKRRFFEEKEDDILQAAIQESKMMIQRRVLPKDEGKRVPLKEEVKRERRILQRVQSAATDYGDDEFDWFSDQDLLALC